MGGGRTAIRCDGGVRVDDPDLDRIVGRGWARELLGLLVTSRDRALGTDEIVDALWGSDAPPTAPTMVHGGVRRLRQALGGGAVVRRTEGYLLDPSSVVVDLWTAEDLLGRGQAQAARALLAAEPFGRFRDRPWAETAIARLERAMRTDLTPVQGPAAPAPGRGPRPSPDSWGGDGSCWGCGRRSSGLAW